MVNHGIYTHNLSSYVPAAALVVYITAIIIHISVSLSAVQIYDVLYSYSLVKFCLVKDVVETS